MKNIISIILCIGLLTFTYLNIDVLVEKTTELISSPEPILPNTSSEYEKTYSLSYASSIEEFIPYSYQDILDIIYTSINKGYESYTFYCPDEYSDCKSDVETISSDVSTLTHINNFVHPFNSFESINVQITDLGEITVTIEYLYTDEQIKEIENEVDYLIDTLITTDDDEYEQIMIIHDYIINNNQYDISINKNEDSPYSSSTAYGALFEGYAICNGYTDLMAIFLYELGIVNIKVATTPDEISYSNTGHIWNAVYLDDTWLHIDLTWDDPVSEDGEDYLFYSYYLLSTDELWELDLSGDIVYEEHFFNTLVYYELVNS